MNNSTLVTNYGFEGIKQLARKFNCSTQDIIELFIDCDYSISRTIEFLERSAIAA